MIESVRLSVLVFRMEFKISVNVLLHCQKCNCKSKGESKEMLTVMLYLVKSAVFRFHLYWNSWWHCFFEFFFIKAINFHSVEIKKVLLILYQSTRLVVYTVNGVQPLEKYRQPLEKSRYFQFCVFIQNLQLGGGWVWLLRGCTEFKCF